MLYLFQHVGRVAPRLDLHFAGYAVSIDDFSDFKKFLFHFASFSEMYYEKLPRQAMRFPGQSEFAFQLLNLRFLAASDFFLRLTLGFS